MSQRRTIPLPPQGLPPLTPKERELLNLEMVPLNNPKLVPSSPSLPPPQDPQRNQYRKGGKREEQSVAASGATSAQDAAMATVRAAVMFRRVWGEEEEEETGVFEDTLPCLEELAGLGD